MVGLTIFRYRRYLWLEDLVMRPVLTNRRASLSNLPMAAPTPIVRGRDQETKETEVGHQTNSMDLLNRIYTVFIFHTPSANESNRFCLFFYYGFLLYIH